MKFKKGLKPTRFALVIFLILVVFCLAQLSWWIIYQIDLSKQLSRHKAELLNQRIEITVLAVNRCFQQKLGMLSYAMNVTENTGDFFDGLLSDSAIIGFATNEDGDGKPVVLGRIDSTFYADIAGGTVYFDPHYPEKSLASLEGTVVFDPTGHHGGEGMNWISPEMFSISPAVREEMEREIAGRIKMFASEGSFFVIIILFGAFLIYRTLQRSEGLKFRQQNFIHAVTHEFRTPLTSLRLYIQTLQAGKIDENKKQELYAKMLDDCYRLDGMVDNVLDAGHSSRNDYKLNLTPTDLAVDLNEYLSNFEPLIRGLGGRIETRIEPNVNVRTDYQALERAIRMIVENALKYSDPNDRVVTVSLSKDSWSARISIADNGVGIPKEEQGNIFDRFYRIDNESTRTVKGTGLGLYLARQTVENHGGRIKVESEGIGRGSVFTITLPLVS
ncbi:MAG TPA: HAMP domain-containing histidine kinase [candidate division Zixibacteria bacterium]|nr:HAMP domain-containing histidine kinase [candidate division Zixibacteria bacterium]